MFANHINASPKKPGLKEYKAGRKQNDPMQLFFNVITKKVERVQETYGILRYFGIIVLQKSLEN